jgi:hypothetical protein
MKYLGLIIILFSFAQMSAQENDTSVLRKNGVVEVEKYQFVHAFIDNTDSCLLDFKRYDTLTRLVYHKLDMRCMGYKGNEETIFEYGDFGFSKVTGRRDDEDFTVSTYSFEDKEKEPVVINTFFLQTNDSMTMSNSYFRNEDGLLDSSITVTILQDGSRMYSRSVARYNADDKLIQLVNADEQGEVTQMASYEIDKSGLLLSSSFATYGEKPYFVQTYFEYNQKGQISNSVNTVNQKQEFFYHDNGLLMNILSYDPKGKLEVEYIFKYNYLK